MLLSIKILNGSQSVILKKEAYIKIIETKENEIPFWGFRTIDYEVKKGTKLRRSTDMRESSDRYGKKLNGTCCTQINATWLEDEILENFEFHRNKYQDIGWNIIVIGGDRYEYGDDDREVIIKNAKVYYIL